MMEKPAVTGKKPPKGEKRQFLVSMDPKLIRAVKMAALEDDRTASSVIEDAARAWLSERTAEKARP